MRNGELQILNALTQCIPEPEQENYLKQIKNITHVQRINNQEIDFYCKKKGKVVFYENIKLSMDSKEFKLATVSIRSSRNHKKALVDIWLVNGYIFSLELQETYPLEEMKHTLEILSVKCHK